MSPISCRAIMREEKSSTFLLRNHKGFPNFTLHYFQKKDNLPYIQIIRSLQQIFYEIISVSSTTFHLAVICSNASYEFLRQVAMDAKSVQLVIVTAGSSCLS